MKRTLLLITLVAVAACQVPRGVAHAGTLRIVHSIDFDSETTSGSGVTWDGRLLWVTGSFPEHEPLPDDVPYPPQPGRYTFAHGLDPSNGTVRSYLIHSYKILNRHGLVWDGNDFWLAAPMAVWGLPVDTASDTIYRFSADGTLVDVLEAPLSPDAWPSGLAWDGADLWISDEKHDRIMQVDPADMSVVSSFESPGPEPRGLTWDGSSLWSVDASNDLIYQIDPSGEVMETWSAPGTDPYGIAYDGQYLWVLDNDSRKIYQCEVPEPSALALFVIAVLSVSTLVYRRRDEISRGM